MTTPSLSTSSTDSIWLSHSEFSISSDSPLVAGIVWSGKVNEIRWIRHSKATSEDGISAGRATEIVKDLLPEENNVCVAQLTRTTRERCACWMRCFLAR